eukprot:scaffold29538_cov120-Isochrysis_galbana.AAC.4
MSLRPAASTSGDILRTRGGRGCGSASTSARTARSSSDSFSRCCRSRSPGVLGDDTFTTRLTPRSFPRGIEAAAAERRPRTYSWPRELKPYRLMTARSSSSRKTRGFGFPG